MGIQVDVDKPRFAASKSRSPSGRFDPASNRINAITRKSLRRSFVGFPGRFIHGVRKMVAHLERGVFQQFP
eukprot:11202075-Lingulodinium_polyedra.AAC.1